MAYAHAEKIETAAQVNSKIEQLNKLIASGTNADFNKNYVKNLNDYKTVLEALQKPKPEASYANLKEAYIELFDLREKYIHALTNNQDTAGLKTASLAKIEEINKLTKEIANKQLENKLAPDTTSSDTSKTTPKKVEPAPYAENTPEWFNWQSTLAGWVKSDLLVLQADAKNNDAWTRLKENAKDLSYNLGKIDQKYLNEDLKQLLVFATSLNNQLNRDNNLDVSAQGPNYVINMDRFISQMGAITSPSKENGSPTNMPGQDAKTNTSFDPAKTNKAKYYGGLPGISGLVGFLTDKGASENTAKQIAMLVSYDVKYGGGMLKDAGIKGSESTQTAAVRNYIKAAYDSLTTDAAKAQFLQDLAEFYYNGVGKARKQIALYASDKESVKGNKFIDALFAKNENLSAEMKSLSIGLDQFSEGLFNGYGVKSVKFDYKNSDFNVKDLNHPLEGEAKFSITLDNGKIVEGSIANHIIGAYLAAISGNDADKTGEALKGIVAYLESQKTITKTVAPKDLEPKDLKKEPVKDISQQTAIDKALDLVDTKKEQQQPLIFRPRELESAVNSILNSTGKTDWESIYGTLAQASKEDVKAEIDGLVAKINGFSLAQLDGRLNPVEKEKYDFALLQLVSFYKMNFGPLEDVSRISGVSVQEHSLTVLSGRIGWTSTNAFSPAYSKYNDFMVKLFQESKDSELVLGSGILKDPAKFSMDLEKALPLVFSGVSYDAAKKTVTVKTRKTLSISKAAENILQGDEGLQNKDKVKQTEPKGYIQNNANIKQEQNTKADEQQPNLDDIPLDDLKKMKPVEK